MAGAGASQPEPQAPAGDPALPLLSEVRFREDYRCFTAGQVLTFDKGVNLLVGEQGSGKSTLISLLRDRVGTKFKAELSHRVIGSRRCSNGPPTMVTRSSRPCITRS